MKIAFFGTPAFAVPSLDALAESPHEVVGVITQPDRARGRGQKVTFAPVKARALERGIPVLQPERLKADEFLNPFDALRADLCVVAAYGRILPQLLLDRPRLGMINVHASLLPRWRGAAPIHRAILAGDAETGITIMRVVFALDAGPMLARSVVPIGDDETSVSLEGRLADAGARLVVDVVDRLAAGPVIEDEQDESLVTYAARIERADGQVTWARPARDIHNQIRGLHPWPHAATVLKGKRLLLIESRVEHEHQTAATPGQIIEAGPSGLVVATAPGAVRLLRVQAEGRPVVHVRDFLNGHPMHPGDTFALPVATS